MYRNLFGGLFDTDWMNVISIQKFLICMAVSLVIGLIIALGYMYKSRYSRSFVTTLAVLPAVVCVVIMMVNGNIGAGVAVAGAFSLVRFRSVPGSAKEIVTLFFAMSCGLMTGMGYLGYALIFAIIMTLIYMLYNAVNLGGRGNKTLDKTLNIVIPESLDYTGVFDDIFADYLSDFELTNVKTTNMGSMFKLTYDVVLKKEASEKEMIDKLRCRNGNLEINVSKRMMQGDVL